MNELKFLPRVRAWDAFSVRHPLMKDRYLLVRRGQKLDEGHNGTTRVTVALCKLRWWITRATGGTTKHVSELNAWAKKSIPDIPGFQKREKNLGSFAL